MRTVIKRCRVIAAEQRSAILLLLLALLPLGALFLWASIRAEVVALRDGAHYYEPLYRWLADEHLHGKWPLWNPWENAGVPLAADPTAALWYPGRLVFLLPLTTAARYNSYLLLHLVLAAIGCFRWARAAGRSRSAALLATLSYVYGAPLLFQYCNVIFLVGAAWFPWGGCLIERLHVARREPAFRWLVVALASVLALTVLGGDPQAAYHLMLLAMLRLFCGATAATRNVAPSESQSSCGERALTPLPRPESCPDTATGRLSLTLAMGMAGLLAAGLAAVQILPSWQAARASERLVVDSPTAAESDATHGESLAVSGDSHADHRYDFSVGPWRLTELLWPNIGGRMFPENRRWWSVLSEEGRVWCPSLYVGLVPLLFALRALRFVRGSATTRWLSWFSLCAILAASGRFGGVYWLLLQLLPGYGAFRYPAKWSVLAALGIAQLAAHGWDDWHEAKRDTTRAGATTSNLLALVACVLVASALAGGGLALFYGTGRWSEWLGQAPRDTWLGPLDTRGAAGDAAWGVIQTFVVGLLLLTLIIWRRSMRDVDSALGRNLQTLKASVLLLTLSDLVAANHWLVVRLPSEPLVQSTPGNRVAGRIYRGYWDEWLPATWSTTRDPDRLHATIAWERATQFPKTNLPHRTPIVSAEESLRSHEWKVFLEVAAERGLVRPDRVLEPRPDLLGTLAIETWYVPRGLTLPGFVPVDTRGPNGEIDSLAIWRAPQPLPRVWLVAQVQLLPLLTSYDDASLRNRTAELFDLGGAPVDWRKVAIVESASPVELANSDRGGVSTDHSPTTDSANSSIRWLCDDANRIEFEIETAQPALCVVADRFDQDWQAELRRLESPATHADANRMRGGMPTSVPILRTNRVVRGIIVPAGRHRLTLSYRPHQVFWGGLISIVCWCIVLSGFAWRMLRRLREAAAH